MIAKDCEISEFTRMSRCALTSQCCIVGGRVIIFIAYTYELEVLIAIQFLETGILSNLCCIVEF